MGACRLRVATAEVRGPRPHAALVPDRCRWHCCLINGIQKPTVYIQTGGWPGQNVLMCSMQMLRVRKRFNGVPMPLHARSHRA